MRAAPFDDRYVPDHGDPTYGVRSYDLVLTCTLESNLLSGRATMVAEALEDLDRFALDLYGLRVSKVKVDGGPVAKYTQRRHKLIVKPRARLVAGQEFTVEVTYAGSPGPMPGLDGDAGWEELEDGLIVASQPHGAPSWFPCNDRPSDKATYRFEVTAPNDYTVVTNGVGRGSRRRASMTTWIYEEAAPMASYLATLQVGRYTTLKGSAAGVPLRTMCPPGRKSAAARAFGRQPEMMEFFAKSFGPYPFGQYTALITDDELEIPLEAQSLSIFGSNFIDRQWRAQRLIAHEMAHQWFGNSLTLRDWRDIWLHEGFACYAEWLWSEESGGPAAAQHASEHWDRLAGLPQDLLLADPGPDLMFDDRVYKRGALTLHALRLTIGDEAFFDLLRAWTARHAYGSITTQDFIDLVAERCDLPADQFFHGWLTEVSLPDLPAG